MIWTKESARLLERAYRYGSAVKTLADWMKLKPGARVCDVGCGVGALSAELARRGLCVTALDISSIALAQLENTDIDVRCEDARLHAPDEPYDAMVFCFFSEISECLRIARRCCAGDVFYISRDYDMHRFSVGSHPVRYSGYRDARAALDAMHVPYDAEECALDMGQPFENLEEARCFFALYSRDDPALITDEFLKSKLVNLPRRDYPLYLPHMRRAGMIHFRVQDVPGWNAGV
ncbi:MAG: class I SAM-dependent methyltransferase [Clostridiales bacterium]|nr:class I SAM-dependent methyltransferase [Clostridiales bacterium]